MGKAQLARREYVVRRTIGVIRMQEMQYQFAYWLFQVLSHQNKLLILVDLKYCFKFLQYLNNFNFIIYFIFYEMNLV